MPKIIVDNKSFEVHADKNLLEACLSLGFDLPYFCWHPALGSVGACRQCAVKIYKDDKDTSGRLVMSCMENVRDGLRLSISDTTAKAFREQVIEWLMTNHPHDCPVCDEGGSCHLQDMTVMTGHDYRRFRYKKRTYINQYLGPFIHHEMNRCIQCYRCVRFYGDYAGGKDLNVFAAHDHVYFGREKDGVLESPYSGNLSEVCPTGVFTDKTLKEHYTRKWDLTTAPSVCQHCSLGCNIIAGERYGKLRCITNRYNSEVNGYFICDRGRFGYDFVNSESRVTQPVIRNRTVEAVDEDALMNHLKSLLSESKLIGIGSPRASMETNFALMQLVGKENFYQGVSDDQAFLEKRSIDILQSGAVHTASLKDIEESDAVVILGEDVWNNASRMALSIRQSVMNSAAAKAIEHIAIPAWHDAAVKELVQTDKGYLANITVAPSPLDEIANVAVRKAPADIARLGFAIAHELNVSIPAPKNADESITSKAREIANALQQAKRPVIISGVSPHHEALLRAAFDIAAALNILGKESGISFVLPECNSMGVAMMNIPSIEKALVNPDRLESATVIIAENDLYRHLPPDQVETIFKRCKNIIVLDSLHNRTTEKAHVLIPAATFAEGDGTLVNNEGRAQRFCQVYVPANENLQESWKWLSKTKDIQSGSGNGLEYHPDELLINLEATLPQFKGITMVAPTRNFRINGQAIPREPHRYSGRTAMQAHHAVSEPKPPQDNDSPMSYTMEGYQGIPPSPLIPFFWAPGWNSVQSVNKYQQEVGGTLKGGDPGVRFFEQKKDKSTDFFSDSPEGFLPRQQKWLLLPQYHLFGSDELSVHSDSIRELSAQPFAWLSKADAEQLSVKDGSMISLRVNEEKYSFSLKIQETLRNGIVLVSAGLPGLPALHWGSWIGLEAKKEN